MSGHVPGPWSFAHREGDDHLWRTEVFDAAGETIATLAWYPVKRADGSVTTSREDNARLISAAPDLLKAARHLSACNFPDEVDFRCDGCNAARDAIEKATR